MQHSDDILLDCWYGLRLPPIREGAATTAKIATAVKKASKAKRVSSYHHKGAVPALPRVANFELSPQVGREENIFEIDSRIYK